MYIFYDAYEKKAYINKWNSKPIKDKNMSFVKALEMALKWGVAFQYDSGVED